MMKQGDGVLMVGGEKGHVVEPISGNVLQLYRLYRWKPLPNCTGRYTCRDHKLVSHKTPTELVSSIVSSIEDIHEFVLPGRTDMVKVLALDGLNETGIITYVKEDEDLLYYVHTLNTKSGFRRKLEAIGIRVTDTEISKASVDE